MSLIDTRALRGLKRFSSAPNLSLLDQLSFWFVPRSLHSPCILNTPWYALLMLLWGCAAEAWCG